MSFDYPEIESWVAQYTDWDIFEGPDLPEFPDKCVVVTMAGGGTLTYEGMFDQVMFQVLVRGSQSNQAEARQQAAYLDEQVTFAAVPFDTGEHTVNSVQRTGGRPTPMPRGTEGQEDGSRYVYTCTYLVQVST